MLYILIRIDFCMREKKTKHKTLKTTEHAISSGNKKVLSSSTQFHHPVLIFGFSTTHYSPLW